jgi:hypothetical protein
MNQTQMNCLNSLENAHTTLHQAIELLKKESIKDSKEMQAKVLNYIATSLQYL